MVKKKIKPKARKAVTGRTRAKKADKMREEMRLGMIEEDVYSNEGREELLEDDEINPDEEGFMLGYTEGDKLAKCARCGKVIVDDAVEREISGKIFNFCSDECAKFFEPEIE